MYHYIRFLQIGSHILQTLDASDLQLMHTFVWTEQREGRDMYICTNLMYY